MSVGRAQGTHIARDASLVVHPLLNTPQSLDPAKYVPYTPRQRQPTPTTTAQHTPGSTPTKPQLANLRTAAQAIGLDVTSVGWAILDKIAYEGDTSDEWAEIWNALTKAKATLLLPSEPSSGQDAIAPEFVQDHVLLCDRDSTSVVTLSGLRGQLLNDSLTFRSTLHRSTKSFQALWTPSASRLASLDALPPLPAIPSESSYPSCTIATTGATLPLPPRATKPPLPPRPGVRGASAQSTARLSMPFATLFGQRSSTPPPLPPPAAASSTTTATTAPSSTSTSTFADADTPIDISACIVDTTLVRTDIATALLGALKSEIAIALADQPPWLVERVHAFAAGYVPFAKVPVGKKKLQDIQVGGGGVPRVAYAVQGAGEKVAGVAERFQAFYRAVEEELRDGGRLADGSGREDDEPVEEKKAGADEVRIREVLETIEATLCTLFYDRLFLPSTSDDASHNEALSSRIAALNMLDLGLEHLDIDIGDADRAEVDAVVRACGETLSELDHTARSPHEKAAVLVSAHKLVVDGLSKIPPIRLKSRDDADDASAGGLGPTQATDDIDAPAALLSVSAPESTNTQSPSIPSLHLSTSPNEPSDIKQLSEPEPVSTSSPVSGDVLLPILIFSVVKANPSRLVSHLLYTQRFRNQSFGGEESYCLINLMAVAEFLENVDLSALGLGESENKVISTADLSPISATRPAMSESPIAAALPADEHMASLRGRVGLGVDAIAGSANKVITGVFDSSFGVLRALLPGPGGVYGGGAGAPTGSGLTAVSGSGSTGVGSTGAGTGGEADAALAWGARPGLGTLRRESGFSIAGLTAGLPGKARGQGQAENEGHRELVEVSSRPPSVRSQSHEASGSEGEAESSEDEGDEDEDEREEGEEGEGEEGEEEAPQVHDARSIRSFESMLSSGRPKRPGMPSATPSGSATTGTTRRRKRLTDLTDRLTHGMAEMSRRVQGGDAPRAPTVSLNGKLSPPNRRFVECTEQDIRVSEVGELLREYQRLVEAVRSAGGFQE